MASPSLLVRLSWIGILTALGITPVAFAKPFRSVECFDLSRPVLKPLSELTTQPGFGEHPKGGGWARAYGRLEVPITRALELVLDQSVFKNPKDCKMTFVSEARAGYLDFQKIDITFYPVPFYKVNCQEEWGFEIKKGTKEKPEEVLVSYQKTTGTDHIRKFCGNILLTPLGPQATLLRFYEETDALHRSPEAIAKGHEGTMRTLQERIDEAKRPEQLAESP